MTEASSGTTAEREFTDGEGRRWHVSYGEGPGVRGLVTMRQIVFRALDGIRAGERRYLSVFPGFLERAGDHELEVALGQAQSVDPPW